MRYSSGISYPTKYIQKSNHSYGICLVEIDFLPKSIYSKNYLITLDSRISIWLCLLIFEKNLKEKKKMMAIPCLI